MKFLNTVQVDTDVLYVDASNDKVGIGTTSPKAKLHVVNGASGATWTEAAGTTGVFESSTSDRSFVTITGEDEAELWFGDFTTQAKGRVRYQTDTNVMSLWTNNTPKITIDAAANVGNISNVGIGTTVLTTISSPVATLSLGSLIAGVSGGIAFQVSGGVVKAYNYVASDYLVSSTVSGIGQIFYGAGSEQMRIHNTTGNVGIGTTNPGAKLDVVQATTANGAAALHLIGPNTNPGLTSSVLIIEQSDGKKITMDGNDIDVSSGDLFINDYSGEDVTFGGQIKVKGLGNPVGDSYIANGNFGVGTTSPSEKLEVNGTIKSNAIITGTNLGINTAFGENFINSGSGTTIRFGSPTSYVQNVYVQGALQTVSSIQYGSNASAASAALVGSQRYRTNGNNSYVDVCMQTGASTYTWVNIVTNSW